MKKTVGEKGRQPISSFQSVADKSNNARISRIETIAFITLLVTVVSFILSVFNIILISKTQLGGTSAPLGIGKWIECQTENFLGYEVMSDWEAGGLDRAIMFKPTDTTVISVSCENLSSINTGDRELKCTNDTLEEFLDAEFAKTTEADIKTLKLSCEEVTVMTDTPALKYCTAQSQEAEGSTVTTYATMYAFLFDDCLCSFTYTTSLRGYVSEEFNHVISSIRVIPEDERDVITPNKEGADTLVSGYSDLGSDVTTSSQSE